MIWVNFVLSYGQGELSVFLVYAFKLLQKISHILSQLKLSRYETSIKSHDAGILLMADIAHKVMRTDTVYDLLQETHRADPNNFQNSFKQKVLGMTVLTGYNNSTVKYLY